MNTPQFPTSSKPPASKARLFGLEFDAVTLPRAVQQIVEAAKARRTGIVVTPNVDQIVKLDRDSEMAACYQLALHTYADGMPIVWLSRIVGRNPLPARVTGADLLPSVCEAAALHNLSVFFFGGDPGIAEQAADNMQRRYPGLIVAGTSCPPYGFEKDPAISNELVREINASNTDILFLGVGAPKQEKWGTEHLGRLQVGPMLCVGASLAFAAGEIQRAPEFVQNSGFEWLWRLILEPHRLWRRYLLDDIRFLPRALNEFIDHRRQRSKR